LRPEVEHSDRVFVYKALDESALALRKAWGLFLLLGVTTPLFMILAIFYLLLTPLGWYDRAVTPLDNVAGWTFFIGGMTWISLTVPLGFYLRSKYWAAYYRGEVVAPGDYIKGNLAIWIPLVIAGVVGFIAFAGTRFVANLFTSVTAFVIYMSMFPNGHAMTRPIGDHDDSGVYEEPK